MEDHFPFRVAEDGSHMLEERRKGKTRLNRRKFYGKNAQQKQDKSLSGHQRKNEGLTFVLGRDGMDGRVGTYHKVEVGRL